MIYSRKVYGFLIVNLVVPELEFQIPSAFGAWEFRRTHNYDQLLRPILDAGACGNTFEARVRNFDVRTRTEAEFNALCDEVVTIGLLLSWLTARCVTTRQALPHCEVQFIQMGDHFLPPRGIVGFPDIERAADLSVLLQRGVPALQTAVDARRLKLMLCHWLSGLTCFTLEDLFINAAVQMDIVKQCEITEVGRTLTYYDGMLSASTRFHLPQLSADYKDMRNSLLHTGTLAGANPPTKTKAQCVQIVADTLNWIDAYIAASLGLRAGVGATPRWHGRHFSLPSFSNPA
jgi:hypothetical protein